MPLRHSLELPTHRAEKPDKPVTREAVAVWMTA
jgi:hypothetical protein